MQYFTPPGDNFYVGDCMPFFDGEIFHLFYLIDEGHHQGNNGLGGHEWAHFSSPNLKTWTEHPIALKLDKQIEGSICTGSVFQHDNKYYAFYATRNKDWTQHLSYAISDDCLNFQKSSPNPLMTAPQGYVAADFRDPFVFANTEGRFQMLITSRIAEYPLKKLGGCIMRMSSDDLLNWKSEGTVVVPGGPAGEDCVPECPDLFYWKGWYYLLFGTKHQTSYLMSRKMDGPWIRPLGNILGTSWMLSVMKTAAFIGDRRIGAGWIGERENDKDDGKMLWGGSLVFREFIQLPDGRLGTKFLKEVTPISKEQVSFEVKTLTKGVASNASEIILKTEGMQAVAILDKIPSNFRLQCDVEVYNNTEKFSFGLKGSGDYESMYNLVFDLRKNIIRLEKEVIHYKIDLNAPFKIDIIVKDTIIDVCVGDEHCIINRLQDLNGDRIFLNCESGTIKLKDITINEL